MRLESLLQYDLGQAMKGMLFTDHQTTVEPQPKKKPVKV